MSVIIKDDVFYNSEVKNNPLYKPIVIGELDRKQYLSFKEKYNLTWKIYLYIKVEPDNWIENKELTWIDKDYKHPFGDIYVITRKYKLC
mgnify:CR=1 FL=1|tara:strand:- start:768 stop:1034 length:267 start_codon:yes stop_codon:yes gene_type:complete